MRRRTFSPQGDEDANAGEHESERESPFPVAGKHRSQWLPGIPRPADKQADHRRDVQRVVQVALKAQCVGYDERHKERDRHPTNQPGEMASRAHRVASRRRPAAFDRHSYR
jgi:hypothetical protein